MKALSASLALDSIEHSERNEGVEFVEALEGQDGNVHGYRVC
jgi:hypothetical protein